MTAERLIELLETVDPKERVNIQVEAATREGDYPPARLYVGPWGRFEEVTQLAGRSARTSTRLIDAIYITRREPRIVKVS